MATRAPPRLAPPPRRAFNSPSLPTPSPATQTNARRTRASDGFRVSHGRGDAKDARDRGTRATRRAKRPELIGDNRARRVARASFTRGGRAPFRRRSSGVASVVVVPRGCEGARRARASQPRNSDVFFRADADRTTLQPPIALPSRTITHRTAAPARLATFTSSASATARRTSTSTRPSTPPRSSRLTATSTRATSSSPRSPSSASSAPARSPSSSPPRSNRVRLCLSPNRREKAESIEICGRCRRDTGARRESGLIEFLRRLSSD